MIRTQIQLTEKQSQTLRQIAEQDNVSVAEIIRRSVDTYIDTRLQASPEEIEQKLLSIIGIGRSDISDLGTNHDKYLAEIYAEVGE